MKNLAFIGALTALTLSLALILRSCLGSGGSEGAAVQEQPPDALLSQRLAIAYGALRDAEGARNILETRRYALAAVDALAGPTGRHGRPAAPPGGVLPADADQPDSEPGLALRAYHAAPERSPLRPAVDSRVLGGVSAWSNPRGRYDAIDQAAATLRPNHDSISALAGEAERALAWALLATRSESMDDAVTFAGRGARAAREALDAVRAARAAAQSSG